MVDRLLRVHMQSPAGLWAWMTQSYNRCIITICFTIKHQVQHFWLFPTAINFGTSGLPRPALTDIYVTPWLMLLQHQRIVRILFVQIHFIQSMFCEFVNVIIIT